MALFSKCLLGSALAVAMAAVFTAATWVSAGLAPGAQQPPPADAPAPAVQAPAPGRDLWGDKLPAGAVARLGTVKLRHGPHGSDLQFTGDGKQLTSLGGGWIRRWDLATGRADVNLGQGWRNDFNFGPIMDTVTVVSADGRHGTICRSNLGRNGTKWTCTEYDLQTGELRREYALAADGPNAAAPRVLSPDGKLLAGMIDGDPPGSRVWLWRTSDGSITHRLDLRNATPRALAFLPDRNVLLVGDDVHTIHVFSLITGDEVRSFGVASVYGVHNLAVAPDGKRLATRGGRDGFVRLWNLAKGTVERTIDFPEDGAAYLLRFTPDSRTLIAGLEQERTAGRRSIRTWDAATGQPGRAWTSDPSIGRAFAVRGDGKLLATINDAGVIRLWNMETGKERQPRPASPSGVVAVGFAADGESVYTVGADYKIRHWDLTGRQQREPRPLAYRGPIAFAPNGLLVANVVDERGVPSVRLENPASGKVVFQATGTEGVLSPDGKHLATSDAEFAIQIHSIPSAERRSLPDAPRAEPRRSKKAARNDQADPNRPKVRGFTADGKSLIVQGDIVSVWDVATGKLRNSWSLVRNRVVVNGFVQSVALSPSGQHIAFGVLRYPTKGVGSSGRVMLFETVSGRLVQDSEFANAAGYIPSLAFSPDGTRLAAGTNQHIAVWQVGTLKERWHFTGHLGRVDSLAFSADGKRLATASNDSTVLIWQLSEFRDKSE